MTRLVGLIGYPVEHSLSPAMHNAAFTRLALDYRYLLMPTPPEELQVRVQQCITEGFAGWNITVPYKQAMLPYLDETSADIRATGACNTVLVDNGKLLGFNTDIAGFLTGLSDAGDITPGTPTVILGAGGSARAVTYALAHTGHPVMILSRKPEQGRELAAAHQSQQLEVRSDSLSPENLQKQLEAASLLVNCTPAGMWPNTSSTPIPEGIHLPPHLLVYDLVYKPRPTTLLQQAASVGCRTQDGLSMLINQGAEAFRIWTGICAPIDTMRYAAESKT